MGLHLKIVVLLAVLCSVSCWRKSHQFRGEQEGAWRPNAGHKHSKSASKWVTDLADTVKNLKNNWQSFLSGALFKKGTGGAWWQPKTRSWFRRKDWWNGPHVCTKREEKNETVPDSKSFHTISNCKEDGDAYICTVSVLFYGNKKTLKMTHECCHGYSRVSDQMGCPKKMQLKGILDTARGLQAGTVVTSIEELGVDSSIGENITFFAPTDNAFEKYIKEREPEVNTNLVRVDQRAVLLVDDLKEVLQYHLVPGVLKKIHFRDDQMLTTLSQSKIRINIFHYPRKMVTANCVPLKTSNNPATNGIVHTIDKVLTPVSQNLLTTISRNPQLTTLKTLIGRTGMAELLRKDGHLTVLAPTNAAFDKLDAALKQRLMNGDSCLDEILKNHILKYVMCSAIIHGRTRTKNLLDSTITLSRDSTGKLFAEGAQLTAKDTMSSNGVLFLMDEVLVPNNALDVVETANKVGTTEVVKLIKAAGLELQIRDLKNFTMFLPTNRAIKNLSPSAFGDVEVNPDALKNILLYHVSMPAVMCSELSSGSNLTSLTPLQTPIRIDEYESKPFGRYWYKTAQCAPIIKRDIKSCNGVIHIVSKVMRPPIGDVIDTLRAGNFSKMLDALESVGLLDTLRQPGPFTVFAPSNQAFERYATRTDKEDLTNLLKRHVLKESLCCAGIFRDNWLSSQSSHRTLLGNSIRVRRDGRRNIFVNNAELTECDVTATNGVVHRVDAVLYTPSIRRDRGRTFRNRQRLLGSRGIFGHRPFDH